MKKIIIFFLIWLIGFSLTNAQGDGSFVKLASIGINHFEVSSLTDDKVELKFKAINYEKLKQRDLKYGYTFKDSEGNEIYKKIFPKNFTLKPGQKKDFLDLIDTKKLYNSDKVSVSLMNKDGYYLSFSSVSNLSKKIPSTFGNSEVVRKNRYLCKIKDDIILCKESKKGDNNVLAKIEIYKKNIFGEKVFEKKIELKRDNGYFAYKIPKLKAGYYEVKFNIGGGKDWYFKFAKAGEYARIDSIRLVKLKIKDKISYALDVLISGKKSGLSLVYGMVDKRGVLSFQRKKISLGKNRLPLKINRIPLKNKKIFLFLVDKNGKIYDSHNTFGKKIRYYEDLFNNNIKNNKDNKIDMIYVIYTGVIFLVLGLFFLFKKKTVSQVLMILGVITASIGLGYGHILADSDSVDKSNEHVVNGGLSGIFGEHYNIVTNLNAGKYGIPGVYLSNEVVNFNLKIVDKDTGKKFKDISAYYSIDGNTYNEIVGIRNTATDYENIGIGALPIGVHRVKIKYILNPIFDVTKFGYGWFDELTTTQTFGVEILDQNNPFGATGATGPDTDGDGIPDPVDADADGDGNIDLGAVDENGDGIIDGMEGYSNIVKDVEFCKKHPTDPDCNCAVYNKEPNEVCEGQVYTRFNRCGDWEQIVGTNPDKCGPKKSVDLCKHDEKSWEPSSKEYCAGAKFIQKDNCGTLRTGIGVSTEDGCKEENIAVLEYTMSPVEAKNADGKWYEYPVDIDVNNMQDNWISVAKGKPIFFRVRPGTGLGKASGWEYHNDKGGQVFKEFNTFGVGELDVAIVRFDPVGPGIHSKHQYYIVQIRMGGSMDKNRQIKIHVLSQTSEEN